MHLGKFYLLCYNAIQLSIWTTVLFNITRELLNSSTPSKIYDSTFKHVYNGQALAWMEVVHAAVGLAGGAVSTTFIQCLGRYVLLVYIIAQVQFVQVVWITRLLFSTWAAADVLRYAFYIVQDTMHSQTLLWLRYSMFYILYPIGIACEWLVYYITLPYIDQHELYSIRLPNTYNFAFDFGVWNRCVLVTYFYVGPFMFMHMVRQRRKKLQ